MMSCGVGEWVHCSLEKAPIASRRLHEVEPKCRPHHFADHFRLFQFGGQAFGLSVLRVVENECGGPI